MRRLAGATARAVLAGTAAALLALGVGAEGAPAGDPEAVVAEIRDRIETDRWAEALDLAREAERRRPADPDVRTALGEALWRAGFLEEAERVAREVVDAGGGEARARVLVARAEAARGRVAEAVETMTRAVAQEPDDPYVLYWAAGFRSTREETVRALERYLEAAAETGADADRVEGVQGTLRLYRALGEREVWVPEERPARVELPLRPIRGVDGRTTGWRVDVRLGERDRPLELLFDTGSPGLFLHERAARKRGFERISQETTFGGGGSGRHRSGRGILSRYDLGGLRYADVLATTSEDAFDALGRTKGLVGLTGFDGYRVTIDLRHGRLRLEPSPERPDEGGAPYWTVAGQLLVRAEADGGGTGLFLLDTGASRTLLDLSFADGIEDATLGPRSRVRSYGGVRREARVVEGVVLRFLGRETAGGAMNAVDLTQRSRLGGTQISGFLGLDLLDGLEVVLDTVHRRVWLLDPDADAVED